MCHKNFYRLNEERFWRNYFYRVSLVRQAALGESYLRSVKVPISSNVVEQEESVKSSGFEDKEAQEEKPKINRGGEISKTSMEEQNELENEDDEAENKKLNKILENIISVTQESSFCFNFLSISSKLAVSSERFTFPVSST